MLTIFAIPRGFSGHTGVIQRNALKSWTLLSPRPDILVFGDEEGTDSVCGELGLRHEKAVARNEFGTPLVSDLFAQAHRLASSEVFCYVNSDIILLDELQVAIETILGWAGKRAFLLVGKRWDLPLNQPIEGRELTSSIAQRARTEGEPGGVFALDYFVFRKGQYKSLPPFAVGRVGWDNWMVYEARREGVPVIDASEVVTAIHQRHDHSHISGGEASFRNGVEAKRNIQLLRSVIQYEPLLCGISDATHLLTHGGVRRSRKRLRRWSTRIVRMGLFHPSLRPYIRAARHLKARLRRIA